MCASGSPGARRIAVSAASFPSSRRSGERSYSNQYSPMCMRESLAQAAAKPGSSATARWYSSTAVWTSSLDWLRPA
jgi:hypothetical protein